MNVRTRAPQNGRLPLTRCLVLGLLVAMSAGSDLSAQSLELRPCRVAGLADARCGTYPVSENRAAPAGRRISLRIALLPALDSAPEPDPILVLQGGPGQSNVGSALTVGRSPLRRRRPILLVDVRGTGGSASLECDFESTADETRTDFLPLDRVRECRQSLSRRADLTRYTSLDVVDDLKEVLDALGIRRVNLWGFSGGTRQALVFLRRHPAMVRSALLEGPVPLDAHIPLTFATDAQAALDGVLDDCLADSACGRRFPRIRQEFAGVVTRLSNASVVVRLGDPGSPTAALTVTRPAFAQVIRYMLYQPTSTRAIPLAVHQAARGDFSLLLDRIRTLGAPGGIAYGFYIASTCTEDVQWFRMEDGVARAAGTYLGDYRVRQQKEACEGWPLGPLPAGYLEPVRTDIPVLILVGERDPVTPPRWGEEIVSHLSRARLLVVPGGGHGFAGLEGQECLQDLRAEFLETVDPARLDARCLGSVRRPPFLLEPPDR